MKILHIFLSNLILVLNTFSEEKLHENSKLIIKNTKVVFSELPYGIQRKRTFRYPIIINDLPEKTLINIKNILCLTNVLNFPFKELLYLDGGPYEVYYTINCNENYVFDITYKCETISAYPDSFEKHYLIDIEKGEIISAKDVFEEEKIQNLKKFIKEKREEIITQKKEYLRKKYNEFSKDDEKTFDLQINKSKLNSIDDFSISKNGITFRYDLEFPHAIALWSPNVNVTMPFNKILPYLKEDNPITAIAQIHSKY